jgi:hypothetical protein
VRVIFYFFLGGRAILELNNLWEGKASVCTASLQHETTVRREETRSPPHFSISCKAVALHLTSKLAYYFGGEIIGVG